MRFDRPPCTSSRPQRPVLRARWRRTRPAARAGRARPGPRGRPQAVTARSPRSRARRRPRAARSPTGGSPTARRRSGTGAPRAVSRASGTSPETPSAPQICTDRSTTRPTASATNVLAIEVACARGRALVELPARPAGSAPRAGRDVDLGVGDHAPGPCRGRPAARRTARRSAARSTAMSWARRAIPSQRMQWVSRAGPSRTCAYAEPLADLAEHRVVGAPRSRRTRSRMWPPKRLSSSVSMCAHDPHARVGRRRPGTSSRRPGRPARPTCGPCRSRTPRRRRR